MRIIGIRIGWLLCAVSCASNTPSRAPELNYHADIAPIFTICAPCHLAGFANGGLSFDNGANDLVSVPSRAGLPYVTAGEPDQSYLLFKLEGTQLDVGGFGARMPIGPPLADEEIDLVACWIEDGASP